MRLSNLLQLGVVAAVMQMLAQAIVPTDAKKRPTAKKNSQLPTPPTLATSSPTKPTISPKTAKPSHAPTRRPTLKPTQLPTRKPTALPTGIPTVKPSRVPTPKPTKPTTHFPTVKPTIDPPPTGRPSVSPSESPSQEPTMIANNTCVVPGNTYELCTTTLSFSEIATKLCTWQPVNATATNSSCDTDPCRLQRTCITSFESVPEQRNRNCIQVPYNCSFTVA